MRRRATRGRRRGCARPEARSGRRRGATRTPPATGGQSRSIGSTVHGSRADFEAHVVGALEGEALLEVGLGVLDRNGRLEDRGVLHGLVGGIPRDAARPPPRPGSRREGRRSRLRPGALEGRSGTSGCRRGPGRAPAEAASSAAASARTTMSRPDACGRMLTGSLPSTRLQANDTLSRPGARTSTSAAMSPGPRIRNAKTPGGSCSSTAPASSVSSAISGNGTLLRRGRPRPRRQAGRPRPGRGCDAARGLPALRPPSVSLHPAPGSSRGPPG